MLSENLRFLRKRNKYTQEQLAEQMNVSRQAIAKWENGETVPDLSNCIQLAKLYHVTLDNLVNYDDENIGIGIPPQGKHMLGNVIVDEEGRIKLTEEAMKLFDLKAGDEVLLLGDEGEGIAMVKKEVFKKKISDFFHILQEE